MTKELTASKKVLRSRSEAKAEAVDMVRREEWAMAKGKQQALKEGEDYYRQYQKKVEENASNLDKMDLLDLAIKADDQLVYRSHRAKLRFWMSNYEGAKDDAKIWVKQVKKECKNKYKIENREMQSLLFQCYLELDNLQAASSVLNRDFKQDSDLFLKHKNELEEAHKNKKN